jgi:hypothetical protein
MQRSKTATVGLPSNDLSSNMDICNKSDTRLNPVSLLLYAADVEQTRKREM